MLSTNSGSLSQENEERRTATTTATTSPITTTPTNTNTNTNNTTTTTNASTLSSSPITNTNFLQTVDVLLTNEGDNSKEVITRDNFSNDIINYEDEVEELNSSNNKKKLVHPFTEDVVLTEDGNNSNAKSGNYSNEDIGDLDEDEELTTPSTKNNEKLPSPKSPKLQTPTTTTPKTTVTILNTATNSPNLQHKHLNLTPPKPTKIIKTYPQFKKHMEEVFAINIRPINHAQINNFFSSEFAVPGGNSTRIYRMESSTLICVMIVDFKFDKKSKFMFLGFWGLWREE